VNDDIDLQIRTVLATVLNRGMKAEDISVDADLVIEYGIDSLEMISFLLAIEVGLRQPRVEPPAFRAGVRWLRGDSQCQSLKAQFTSVRLTLRSGGVHQI
jgi:hypothetical protein